MYNKFYDTYGHSYEEYEKSHKRRLDFLVQDLNINCLKNNSIFTISTKNII